MPEIFEKLGINFNLIVAQAVNFILLLIVLQRFAYKPILKMLNERTEKIEKSLKQAQKIEEELKNTEKIKRVEIEKAKKEAQKIVQEAYEISESKIQESMDRTKAKTKEIVEKAKQEIKAEKEKSIGEAKKEIADLAVQITKKVIGNNISKENQKKLVNETLSKLR